jgi:lipopolysaccharide/colanic/teichoic acid biosynthesis glycosyltransferase
MSEPAPNILREGSGSTERRITLEKAPGYEIFEERLFLKMLYLERKRSERSKRRFIVMLLEPGSLPKRITDEQAFGRVLAALTHAIRETDIRGWYEEGVVFGVIFTELGAADGRTASKAILARINNALGECLAIDEINKLRLSFHPFPEDATIQGQSERTDPALYPELKDFKRSSRHVKRAMDIAGSLCALILLSPLLLLLSIIIKLTSKGPVLFRQHRIGQYGRAFTFLKFRSMYSANDHTIHEEYVKRLIAGDVENNASCESPQTVYKLTNDPRVTIVGKFLRRTSLDEVPQFLNVLKGEMSIVGPRPPLPYEYTRYETWHKTRLLAMKPGITGLWQVEGRSRVTFDEMVRMDLQYARSWSPWMDIKIMFRTPGAMLFGSGAF